MYSEQFMRRAIALSEQALNDPGAKPFGAVVVKDGQIVGEVSTVRRANSIRPRMARSRRSATPAPN